MLESETMEQYELSSHMSPLSAEPLSVLQKTVCTKGS